MKAKNTVRGIGESPVLNPILEANLKAIFGPPRAVRNWLSQPCSSLGGDTPESWINKGKEDEVLEVVKRDFGYLVNY